MFSPFFSSLLAADNRLLTGLPPIFNMPSELLLPVVLAIVAMAVGIWYGKSIRMEDHGWRVGLIAATFLASLAIIMFWEYKLGVDLQGGAILVYEVDEKATMENQAPGQPRWTMSQLMEVLKKRLNPDGLKEIVIRPFGATHIEIVVPEVDKEEVDAIKRKVTETGVLRFLILADSASRDQALWEAATNQALDAKTQEDRLERNVHNPQNPKQIIGFWADVRRQGTKVPQEFAEPSNFHGTMIRNGDDGQIVNVGPAGQAELQRDPAAYFQQLKIKNPQVLMAVDPENDVRGSDLAESHPSTDEQGRPCIAFTMKSGSAYKMGDLTEQNRPTLTGVHRRLGILWDNVLESAPSINSTIRERGIITGQFSDDEIEQRVELLQSGSMPVVLVDQPISDDRIGATLGLDTVRKGSQSIVISLAIVLGFVLIYYRTAGAIACFALVLNMMLTVALMFALKAPFTLPGLAGLVLTVGMSVDANVLIYERIREELEKGAALRMAIRNGFDKALVTIIDSNVTTLLTAVILYIIGTDQVRGFGMTLILGIMTSMFTAIFVSRAILEIGEKAYRWQTLSMLKFFSTTNIDWMKLFRPAAIASTIIIVIGLVATFARGMGLLDIDMAGGTSVQFVLDPKVYKDITEAQVREKVAAAFKDEKVEKTGASVDYNVYQKFLTTGTNEVKTDEMIWKVDSSLKKISHLQEVVRKAFRTPEGREGLLTYGLTVGDISEVTPESARPPTIGAPSFVPPSLEAPANEAPKTETPKAEKPATEEPKENPPKMETPKAGEPVKENPTPTEPAPKDPPKSETPAKDDSKKSDAKSEEKSDSSECQTEEESAKQEPKTDDNKTAEPKSETKKSAEPKSEPAKTDPEKIAPEKTEPAEPAKTDPAKTEPAKTEPAVTDPAPAVTDPASQIPPLAPPPVQPPLPDVKTRAELKLGNTQINASALQERLQAAAKTVLNRGIDADLSAPGWDGHSNLSYGDWTVTLNLPKADAEKVLKQLEVNLAETPVWQTSSEIGGQVAVDTQYRAVAAIVGSIFVMIIYMWIRFHKISWGIAAAVALAHDALVMLGAIAVSYWLAGAFGFLMVEEFKISLPVVAAFLTLIGYSVNDTIVIFDRVREIRGKSPEVTGQMINDAVNQTLSRTFLTAGTTLMVIVILYFLGGSGIHAFAFSLVVGVISGSYSTVFIASPLLVYLIGLDQEKSTKKTVPAATASTTTRGAA